MNDNIDKSRSFTVGNVGGDFKPIGSAIMSDNAEISGTVADSIEQTPVLPDPAKLGIEELLAQLSEAISTSSDLNPDDKAEALEQLKILAEAGKNPSDGIMKKMARTSLKILQGTVAGLPDVAKLVDACSKSLPIITKFFGL
jgi:hypothetical protein